MSQYTMKIKDVIKYYPEEWNQVMNSFPLFDNAYRSGLIRKIEKTLKFREIGYETPELWLDRLDAFFELEMPNFNFLYESNLIKIEPLLRVKLTETFTKDLSNESESEGTMNRENSTHQESTSESSGESTSDSSSNAKSNSVGHNQETNNSNSNNSNNSKVRHSEFPQGNIGNDNGGIDGDGSNYYSYGDDSNSNGSDNSNSNSTSDNTDETLSESASNAKTNASNNASAEADATLEEKQNANNKTNFTEKEQHTLLKEGLTNFTDSEMLEKYLEVKGKLANIDKMLIDKLLAEMTMNIINVY